MTDDEMHADKSDDWKLANATLADPCNFTERQLARIAIDAMHESDGLRAERDMWREQASGDTVEYWVRKAAKPLEK